MEGNQLLFSIEGKINSTQPLCQPCIFMCSILLLPSMKKGNQIPSVGLRGVGQTTEAPHMCRAAASAPRVITHATSN